MSNFWDTQDAKKLYDLLDKTAQPWPYKFMSKINNLVPITGLEVLIFREGKNGMEVFLTKRDADDIDWPNQYHVPGSIVRDSDISIDVQDEDVYKKVLTRVFSQELKLSKQQITNVKYNKCDSVIWKHTRGGSVSIIFICQLDNTDFTVGDFYPVGNLPQPFIKGQEVVIDIALKHIKEPVLKKLID